MPRYIDIGKSETALGRSLLAQWLEELLPILADNAEAASLSAAITQLAEAHRSNTVASLLEDRATIMQPISITRNTTKNYLVREVAEAALAAIAHETPKLQYGKFHRDSEGKPNRNAWYAPETGTIARAVTAFAPRYFTATWDYKQSQIPAWKSSQWRDWDYAENSIYDKMEADVAAARANAR